MKLHQLFETSLADNFSMEDFIDDVAPFLNELMKSNDLVYHGAERFENDDPFSIEKFKLRDKPKDTTPAAYDAMNDWTRRHFHIEPRRWLFVTSLRGSANNYGEARCIFPIGSYDYFFIAAIKDLFRAWRDRVESKAKGGQADEFIQVEAAISMLNEYHKGGLINYNTNLKKAVDYNYEIMLDGTSYYAINPDFLRSEVRMWEPVDAKYKKYKVWLEEALHVRNIE